MMPFPLWIPQVSVPFGAVLLEIAVIEELLRGARGHHPHYEDREREPFTE